MQMTRNPYRRGRISTIDLLHFDNVNIICCFTKQATKKWSSTVLSLSLQLVFLVCTDPSVALNTSLIIANFYFNTLSHNFTLHFDQN